MSPYAVRRKEFFYRQAETLKGGKTMSANVEAKKQIVEEIKAKIQASKSIVLADYNKLTVLEVTELRRKFKEVNCEYKVYKNTLVRKAFNELGITDFDNDLNGTTATVFCADETSGAAVFAKETKANPALSEKVVPKCAFVENKYLDKNGVKALSAIPSKEVLIAKMLGCFQSSLSKFVGVLDQIAKAKESN
ncbi:MAG: 50S ribosomal protein L10 [Clostridiales bacterium]|nr:50S ribosomal protein L10 [Clostridiales bacterium]